MFNFDLKSTAILQAVRRGRFFVFRYLKFLSQLFQILLFFSLCFIGLSFAGFLSSRTAILFFVFSLVFELLFLNLHFFVKTKIKKPSLNIELAEAYNNPGQYNLAELLSFDAAVIMEDALKFCAKRKIKLNSTALFYSSLRTGNDIAIIVYRLGLDIKRLQYDLKNYLEKTPKEQDVNGFSDDFVKVVEFALKVSKDRNRKRIGEKEIFVGLAECSEVFKKIMIEYDLKKEDVQHITLWLDSVEDSFEKSKEFWTYENLSRQGSMGKDWASGYTINLDAFSTDWRRIVSKWAFKEIVGHKKEIEETEVILARSNLSNALIIGDAGTGRKSIIEALAQRCYMGTSLPELNNKRVVELDLIRLATAIQNPEQLETTLDRIFAEAITSGNVILVIDQLENFVGLKENKPGQVDISAILAKYLSIPEFRFVGITSYDGLHKNIEQNSAFVEFFRKVEVKEITEDETIKVLLSQGLDLEYKNKIIILYPSIREIVNLTARYIPSLPFPKKALDILDEAVVYIQTKKEKVVLPHHIAEVVSKKTEIPIGKMEVREKEVLLNLENLIHQRLVNQEEAVKEISIAMRRARAGLASKTRPMGSFLFLGPTGVGKTETAKALAQIYFGNEAKMIRIDMSEFQSVADIPRLIGQVSPVEIEGLLTTQVRETPFSLVLLDEIEKAYPDILNLFLQVLDEGHITDGQGRKVVFTNTIIICTSNGGADLIFKAAEEGKSPDKDSFLNVLFERKLFRPEFVNRFDATIVFHPLTRDNLLKIAQLSLLGLQKSLKEKEIDFEITEDLKEKIVSLSYKPQFGAREMRRVVQDKVENTIAEALISEKIKKGDKIKLNSETFEIIINPIE